MKKDIATGDLHPLDISEDVAAVVQRISMAIRESKSAAAAWESLSGQGLLAIEERGIQDIILETLVENRGNRARLEEAIGNYVEAVYRVGNPKQMDMFAPPPAIGPGKKYEKQEKPAQVIPSREDLWKVSTKPEALVKSRKKVALKAQRLNGFLGTNKIKKTRARAKRIKARLARFEQVKKEYRQQIIGLSPEEIAKIKNPFEVENNRRAFYEDLENKVGISKEKADRIREAELIHRDLGLRLEEWKWPLLEVWSEMPESTQTRSIEFMEENYEIREAPPEIREPLDAMKAQIKEDSQKLIKQHKKAWEKHLERFTGKRKTGLEITGRETETVGPNYQNLLEEKIEAIAKSLGVKWMHGPIKGDRGIVKAASKASDRRVKLQDEQKKNPTMTPEELEAALSDASKINFFDVNDIIRSSIVADSNEAILLALEEIYQQFDVLHNRTKEKYTEEQLAQAKEERLLHKDRFLKDLGGYRDHMLLVELAPGIIGEIQVHRGDVMYAKEIGAGHVIYEYTREIDESNIARPEKDEDGNDLPLDELGQMAKKRLDRLYEDSANFYTGMFTISDGVYGAKYSDIAPLVANGFAQTAIRIARETRGQDRSSISAALASASSFVASEAPDNLTERNIMRSLSETGSSVPTLRRKPGPTSQGTSSSSRIKRFAIPNITPMRLGTQQLQLFTDYTESLPARDKSSIPALKRRIKRDVPAATDSQIDQMVEEAGSAPDADLVKRPGETAKEFRGRVKKAYDVPEKLEADSSLYFDESLATAPVVRVPIDNLTTTRARVEGIANAEKLMAASADGVIPKRKPVDLRDNGDGTFTVLDGNSTTAIARKHNFTELVGQVVEGPESDIKDAEKTSIFNRTAPRTMAEPGNQFVSVDVSKFDELFKKSKDYYIGEGGEGGISIDEDKAAKLGRKYGYPAYPGGRYEQFGVFLNTGFPIQASEVSLSLSESGNLSVQFIDGRHRYAKMRDIGEQKIKMHVNGSK